MAPDASLCDSDGRQQVKAMVSVKIIETKKNINTTLKCNGVDSASSKRKEIRLQRKGGHVERQEHIRSFDLGPIEAEYEPDPTWTSAEMYGNGLKRYIHKKTKMHRAVLTIRKSQIPTDVSQGEVKRQLETLCKIDHPNIVPFREVFEDSKHLRLIYDWCPGGPLVSQLWRYEDKLTEGHVAQIIREILAGLAAAHAFGVHHCDLGLFSIFLAFNDRLSPVKLFGIGLTGFLMHTVADRKVSRTNKHFYASEEIFSGRWKLLSPNQRHVSDVWSVGCILYTICSGRPPFGVGKKQVVMDKILSGYWDFGMEFSQYSNAVLEFIEALLVSPWQKRLGATGCLGLAWLSNSKSLRIGDGGKISSIALQQLNSFVAQDHIRQTLARLLTDIGISDELYPKLEKQFRELDLNGDGTITLNELMEVAGKIPGMTAEGVEQIINKLDRNGNCNVDISEFIAALVMDQDEADERLIQKAFSKMDRNGDARVTKKELFGVLRSYSKSIDVQEVSQFVSANDKDGDKKMDYREFTYLFPQVADKYRDLKKRMDDARNSIKNGSASLTDFVEVTARWLEKLVKMRDKIEIGCDVQVLPSDHVSVIYSYPKGHFSEWEVQSMVTDSLELLEQVPGFQLTKGMKKLRKKNEALNAKRRAGLVKDDTMLGARTLTKNQKVLKAASEAKREAEEEAEASSNDETDQEAAAKAEQAEKDKEAGAKEAKDAKDDKDAAKPKEGTETAAAGEGAEHHHHHHHKKKSAVTEWELKVMADRKERMMDIDYQVDDQVYENLYWLVKVKSDTHWQQPLKEIVEHMRECCTEEIQDIVVTRKQDLSRLASTFNEQYILKDGVDLGEPGSTMHLKKNAHLLPLGCMKGKSMKLVGWLAKMEEIILPAEFVVGHAKPDITHQKVEYMQHKHTDGMIACGKHLTWVIASVQDLFTGVSEDLKMSGALEGSMPAPPNMSHLFLPFCEGREVLDDAATPRSDQEEMSSGEDIGHELSPLASPQSPKKSPTSGLKDENGRFVTSPTIKIERNHVLTTAAVQAHLMKQAHIEEHGVPPPKKEMKK